MYRFIPGVTWGRAVIVLAILAAVALTCFGSVVAQADDPPIYYLSYTPQTSPVAYTYWLVDTETYEGSYHVYKYVSVRGNPEHTTLFLTGTGPDGYATVMVGNVIAPGANDDLPLIAYFYIAGL